MDILFRLAEKSSVVLMDGGGFGGPPWSVRVSLANLDDEDYEKIGAFLREVAEEYLEAWHAGKVGRHFNVIPLPSWSDTKVTKARKPGKNVAKAVQAKKPSKAMKTATAKQAAKPKTAMPLKARLPRLR